MSSPYGLYELGYTHVTLATTKSHAIKQFGANLKKLPCSDYRLQLVYMKSESQVIVYKYVTVNMYLALAHTARHMPGVSFI